MTKRVASKDPDSFFVDTNGLYGEDMFEADEASFMTPDDERELMGWLRPDEQQMWSISKATRRRSIPILLRRIAKMRQESLCGTP